MQQQTLANKYHFIVCTQYTCTPCSTIFCVHGWVTHDYKQNIYTQKVNFRLDNYGTKITKKQQVRSGSDLYTSTFGTKSTAPFTHIKLLCLFFLFLKLFIIYLLYLNRCCHLPIVVKKLLVGISGYQLVFLKTLVGQKYTTIKPFKYNAPIIQ